MPTLLFIDTNVLLDFYRASGHDDSPTILERIADHPKRVIVTSQVEMEFKKNRLLELRNMRQQIQNPQWGSLNHPSHFGDAEQTKEIRKAKQSIKSHVRSARDRIKHLILNPHEDPVYRAADRLFRSKTKYSLRVGSKEEESIFQRAQRRWLQGQPPRKANDTSYGDAINWEWIIHCAIAAKADVVIVSRDGDFGPTIDDDPALNDWLAEEFRARVGSKLKVDLTARLAEGLDQISIRVTADEKKAEDKFLEEQSKKAALAAKSLHYYSHLWPSSVVLANAQAQAEALRNVSVHSELNKLHVNYGDMYRSWAGSQQKIREAMLELQQMSEKMRHLNLAPDDSQGPSPAEKQSTKPESEGDNESPGDDAEDSGSKSG